MFLHNTLFVVGVALVPVAFNPQKNSWSWARRESQLTSVHNCMHIINADHTLQNSKITSKFLEALAGSRCKWRCFDGAWRPSLSCLSSWFIKEWCYCWASFILSEKGTSLESTWRMAGWVFRYKWWWSPQWTKTLICTHESGFKARQSGQEQEKKWILD